MARKQKYTVMSDGCYDRTIEATSLEAAKQEYCNIVRRKTGGLHVPSVADVYEVDAAGERIATAEPTKHAAFNPNRWSENQKNLACGLRSN